MSEATDLAQPKSIETSTGQTLPGKRLLDDDARIAELERRVTEIQGFIDDAIPAASSPRFLKSVESIRKFPNMIKELDLAFEDLSRRSALRSLELSKKAQEVDLAFKKFADRVALGADCVPDV